MLLENINCAISYVVICLLQNITLIQLPIKLHLLPILFSSYKTGFVVAGIGQSSFQDFNKVNHADFYSAFLPTKNWCFRRHNTLSTKTWLKRAKIFNSLLRYMQRSQVLAEKWRLSQERTENLGRQRIMVTLLNSGTHELMLQCWPNNHLQQWRRLTCRNKPWSKSYTTCSFKIWYTAWRVCFMTLCYLTTVKRGGLNEIKRQPKHSKVRVARCKQSLSNHDERDTITGGVCNICA